MRIVVTGAAGFIGSHLAEKLVASGHTVVGVDGFLGDVYSARIKRANIRRLLGHPAFSLAEADLRTAPLEPIIAGADVVVNQAAMPGLLLSWEQLKLYTDCNVVATGRLLDAARRVGVPRFIQISTSSVYGTIATSGEDSVTQPVSPYGVTKLAAEHLVRAIAGSFDMSFNVLRYFSVYGPRQRPDMAYSIFCERILDGKPIEVRGDGLQTRTNTYVDDCVNATILAIHRGVPGETYNISGSDRISVLDAVAILGPHLGTPEPDVVFVEDARGDQRHTEGDTTKAVTDFGLVMPTSIEEGLARQAQWHLERHRQ